MSTLQQTPRRRLLRLLMLLAGVLAPALLAYALWSPGRDIRDGRHDRGDNAIWLGHGWLGDDSWFQRNHKQDQLPRFRDRQRIRELAQRLHIHHIRDAFPHLCPANDDGTLPKVDPSQTERFLDETTGLRVMPWIGGVLERQVFLFSEPWRRGFVRSVQGLLRDHPRLAGIHLNIEPCPSGNRDYLQLLDELRAALPPGKLLSVASYPPPTRYQPTLEVHWEAPYYRQVAKRADQVAIMMYDTALRQRKLYVQLMASWTREVLDGGAPAQVLLGLPAYEDRGVGWHDPDTEDLSTSLRGIHQGLASYGQPPPHYQGVALYSEWEMDEAKWRTLREGFLSGTGVIGR